MYMNRQLHDSTSEYLSVVALSLGKKNSSSFVLSPVMSSLQGAYRSLCYNQNTFVWISKYCLNS